MGSFVFEVAVVCFYDSVELVFPFLYGEGLGPKELVVFDGVEAEG